MRNERDANQGHQVAEQGDWLARQFFSPDDLQASPEEYAARNSHLWGCFSLHTRHYDDAGLGDWVRRLGEILSSEVEIERCRRRFLNPSEAASVEGQAREDF